MADTVEKMQYEEFRVKRAQIARQIYWALEHTYPKDAIRIDEPDDLGAVGVAYPHGYILIRVEDAT